jgi:hypothetical protein
MTPWVAALLFLYGMRYLVSASLGCGDACLSRSPPEQAIIETVLNGGLDDAKIGREIEIAWHKKPVIADVENLALAVVVRWPCVI